MPPNQPPQQYSPMVSSIAASNGSSVPALVNPTPAVAPDLAGQAAAASRYNLPTIDQVRAITGPDPSFISSQIGEIPDPNRTATQNQWQTFAKYMAPLATFAGGAAAPAQDIPASFDNEYKANLTTGPTWADYAIDALGGNKQTTAALDRWTQTARNYSDPGVQKIITSNKDLYQAAMDDASGEFSDKVKALADASRNPPPMTANGKPVSNPKALQTASAQSGFHPDVVHLFQEPHAYSEAEFVNLAKGLSWNQAEKLWGMQHYLTPDQQLTPTILGGLSQNVGAAEKAYNDLVKAGRPYAEQKEAWDRYLAARNEATQTILKKWQGPQYVLPNAPGQGQ